MIKKDGNKIPVCVLTQTARIKTVGHIIESDFDDAKKVMVEIIRFSKEIEAEPERSKQLIDDMIQNLSHGFEVGLITDYSMYKVNKVICNCNFKDMIEKFVAAIGLANFSEYFQTEWSKLQPITYHFGSAKFVVGEEPHNPIDVLVDLLDELDDRRSELGDGDILPDHRMAFVRSVLDEHSTVVIVLNELIQMSKDKLGNGHDFVRGLVGRVGLSNLPMKTQDLYKKIFLPN